MTMVELFVAELTREAATTRRVLERVPDAHLAWRPHAKSMSLGQLAYHISAVPRGVANLLDQPEGSPARGTLPEDMPAAELVANLDRNIAYAVERLQSWGDAGLAETWRFKRGEETMFEQPRGSMVRGVMLNHWYHHRGQLTVYLRMLDVPLPSIYGPSADEQPF